MSRWLIPTFLFAATVFSCVVTLGFFNVDSTWGLGASLQVSIYVAITMAMFCSIGSGLVYSIREKRVPKPAIVVLGAIILILSLIIVNRFVSSIQNFTMLWCVFGAAGAAYLTTLFGREAE